MSKRTDNKNSISSSVFGIKRLLRDFQTDLPALSKKPKASTANNELHAFGVVNIDKARIEFKQQIDCIRSICSQFETEVLGDVMKLGPGADFVFRKHFNQLKEQASTETTVLRLEEHLHQSSALLESALNDKEASASKVKVQQLKKLATSMGLVSFVDSSQKEWGGPSTTITLGGTVIVVDIDIDEAGQVQRTKVTFVPEHLQNDHDENLDLLLAKDLQAHNFDGFKVNLGTLALLDRLNVEHTPTDFFTIVRNLYSDLRTTCNQEALLLSNDILGVLSDGHGIPNLYLDYPGISIAYWIDKVKTKHIDWSSVGDSVANGKVHPSLRNTATLRISFEESKTPHHFLPSHRSNYMLAFDETEESISENGTELKVIQETRWPKFMQPLRFVKPTSSCSAIPIRFVAKLNTPLAASDAIVQKLMESTSLIKEANDTPSPDALDRSFSNALSLEELLVVDVPTTDVGTSPMKTGASWVKAMSDSSDQVYQYLANPGTPGKLIHRIPFHHPAQLYSIMMYLRQQQTFNSLFTSVFNKETYRSDTSDATEMRRTLSLEEVLMASEKDDTLRIEVTTYNAPRTIELSLSPPASTHYPFVSIPVIIDIPTHKACHPRVRLDSATIDVEATNGKEMIWNPRVFNQEEMNKVLQNEFKIPELVAWLWKTLEQHEGNYWLERTLKRSHTSMMDLDDGGLLDTKF